VPALCNFSSLRARAPNRESLRKKKTTPSNQKAAPADKQMQRIRRRPAWAQRAPKGKNAASAQRPLKAKKPTAAQRAQQVGLQYLVSRSHGAVARLEASLRRAMEHMHDVQGICVRLYRHSGTDANLREELGEVLGEFQAICSDLHSTQNQLGDLVTVRNDMVGHLLAALSRS